MREGIYITKKQPTEALAQIDPCGILLVRPSARIPSFYHNPLSSMNKPVPNLCNQINVNPVHFNLQDQPTMRPIKSLTKVHLYNIHCPVLL